MFSCTPWRQVFWWSLKITNGSREEISFRCLQHSIFTLQQFAEDIVDVIPSKSGAPEVEWGKLNALVEEGVGEVLASTITDAAYYALSNRYRDHLTDDETRSRTNCFSQHGKILRRRRKSTTVPRGCDKKLPKSDG